MDESKVYEIFLEGFHSFERGEHLGPPYDTEEKNDHFARGWFRGRALWEVKQELFKNIYDDDIPLTGEVK